MLLIYWPAAVPTLGGYENQNVVRLTSPCWAPGEGDRCVPGPARGAVVGAPAPPAGDSPQILTPGTAPTKRHKTETPTWKRSRLHFLMPSHHCSYCSMTPQRLPYTRVLFSRNTFGSKIYTHLLCRKRNIRLFQAARFYVSLGAPTLPFEHDAGAHLRSEFTHRFHSAVPSVTAQNSPSAQGAATFWMRRKSRHGSH